VSAELEGSAGESAWPRATADLPGSGGHWKVSPEDFVVEELPAYVPSGAGEHLYLWIEKRGRSTQDVVRALARATGVREDDIGVAGQKDRQAVTRQFLSLPAKAEAALSAFVLPDVKILSTARHGNKLRTGHLAGNRFELWVRDVKDAGAARAVLERLARDGVPNYFGEQRFGVKDDNAALGKLLLLGERLPSKPDRFRRKLYLSAFQSLLFNRALAARVEEKTFHRALAGDVLRKEASGGVFVCEDVGVDQPRVDAWEVSPAGPMFGPKMIAAHGSVAAVESRLLEAEGLTLEIFERGKGETEGTRRPYRIPLKNAEAESVGSDLHLRFDLPRGAYATVVLAELVK
jgi:tRNA pseudouridine13 synthase